MEVDLESVLSGILDELQMLLAAVQENSSNRRCDQ